MLRVRRGRAHQHATGVGPAARSCSCQRLDQDPRRSGFGPPLAPRRSTPTSAPQPTSRTTRSAPDADRRSKLPTVGGLRAHARHAPADLHLAACCYRDAASAPGSATPPPGAGQEADTLPPRSRTPSAAEPSRCSHTTRARCQIRTPPTRPTAAHRSTSTTRPLPSSASRSRSTAKSRTPPHQHRNAGQSRDRADTTRTPHPTPPGSYTRTEPRVTASHSPASTTSRGTTSPTPLNIDHTGKLQFTGLLKPLGSGRNRAGAPAENGP
jgi:hypothetical protein